MSFTLGKLSDFCLQALQVRHYRRRDANGQPASWAGRCQNLASVLEQQGAVRWQTNIDQPNKFEALSLAACEGAILKVLPCLHCGLQAWDARHEGGRSGVRSEGIQESESGDESPHSKMGLNGDEFGNFRSGSR